MTTTKLLTNSPDYDRISEFLTKRDFFGFTGKDLFIKNFIKKGWGQDIAALSNMAEALSFAAFNYPSLREQITPLLDQTVIRATHKAVSPYKKSITKVTSLGQFCYYLEHLNIILGHYQRVADDKYFLLNQRISQHLLEESLSHKNVHARLLPGVKMRWSADQAAIIYSLWLYDQNNQTQLSEKLSIDWLSYMESHRRHLATGLFATEVMRAKSYSEQPRGCSSAYMIYYMSHFAPDTATKQWGLFKQHLGKNALGTIAFREYLNEYKGGWTPDSGPILFGLGVAATGLTLKTAAAMNDQVVYKKLSRLVKPTTALCRFLGNFPVLNIAGALGSDLLASSIRLAADQLILTKGSVKIAI